MSSPKSHAPSQQSREWARGSQPFIDPEDAPMQGPCMDRNEVLRAMHTFDKDNVCIFCDRRSPWTSSTMVTIDMRAARDVRRMVRSQCDISRSQENQAKARSLVGTIYKGYGWRQ